MSDRKILKFPHCEKKSELVTLWHCSKIRSSAMSLSFCKFMLTRSHICGFNISTHVRVGILISHLSWKFEMCGALWNWNSLYMTNTTFFIGIIIFSFFCGKIMQVRWPTSKRIKRHMAQYVTNCSHFMPNR